MSVLILGGNERMERNYKDLCKEYEGTVYYGRYIDGEWTLAEGLIYPMYKDALVPPQVFTASEYAKNHFTSTDDLVAIYIYDSDDCLVSSYRKSLMLEDNKRKL